MTGTRHARPGFERLGHGLLIAVVLTLTACAQYTLVKGDKRIEVGDAFSVEPQIAWTRIANPLHSGKTEVWTVDGPFLQLLRFYKGIDDSQVLEELTDSAGNPIKNLPTFTKDMSPIEISELFETTLARAGAQQFKMDRIRPATFAGTNGFRFDFHFAIESGLKKIGFAVGAVRDGKLYMISYVGTSLHYFGKDKGIVEHLIGSAQMI